MANFTVSHDIKRLQARIQKRQRFVDRLALDEIEKEGHKTHADLVKETPRRWTGNTRRGWKSKTVSTSPPWVRVYNNEPVMFWLVEGTRRRYPKRSKNLFIPLRHSAWTAGGYKSGMKWGKDFVFAKSARGIKPHKIVPKQLPTTVNRLRRGLRKLAQF